MKTPDFSIIRSHDYITAPWKNGGGTSRQIFLEPTGLPNVSEHFLWQAGIADIDRDGAFSDFTGYDRIFTLVSGNGITLDAGENGTMRIADCFQPQHFSGDWQVTATLHDGPAQAFNIVCDRAGARASVEMTSANQLADKLSRESSVILIHNFSKAPLEIGGLEKTSIDLLPGDTLLLNGLLNGLLTGLPMNISAFTQSIESDRIALAQICYL